MDYFGKLMFESLNEAVRLVLGENICQLIYSFIKRQPSLKLEEVGDKIGVVTSYLEKLLGKEGAQIIQTFGIKRLCLKLKREYEEVEDHFVFLDELYEIKFRLLVASSRERSSVCN